MASSKRLDVPTRSSNAPLRVPGVVYLINATLLICHEIDSAYWREWELFHIPGGSIVFVMLTAHGDHSWRWYSLMTGVAVRRYPAHQLADCRKRTVFDVVLNIADFGVPPRQHRPSCGHRIVVETNVTSRWFSLERKDAIAGKLCPELIRLAM